MGLFHSYLAKKSNCGRSLYGEIIPSHEKRSSLIFSRHSGRKILNPPVRQDYHNDSGIDPTVDNVIHLKSLTKYLKTLRIATNGPLIFKAFIYRSIESLKEIGCVNGRFSV